MHHTSKERERRQATNQPEFFNAPIMSFTMGPKSNQRMRRSVRKTLIVLRVEMCSLSLRLTRCTKFKTIIDTIMLIESSFLFRVYA